MGMVLLGVVLVQCLMIPINLVMGFVQFVEVVVERMGRVVVAVMLSAVGILVSAGALLFPPLAGPARHEPPPCTKSTPTPTLRRQNAFS